MAAAEQDLLFESFLKKRKDTLIYRWSNYWFRLRNTTLSFYTSREANESCLRGKYYIYLIQSVREVKATGASHTFEIVMKNGKRKLLSAKTAALCKIWVQFLWKSMQLPAPGRNSSSCTWHDMPTLEKTNAAVQNRPESRSELKDSQSKPVKGSPADSYHSENESYSEDDDSSLNPISDQTSQGIAEQGNEKNSDDKESIYDVPTWRNYGEPRTADTVEKENKEDDENQFLDIYCSPTSKPASSKPAVEKENKGGDESMSLDLYSSPNSKSVSSKPAGVTTDQAEEKSTDSAFTSQDEN